MIKYAVRLGSCINNPGEFGQKVVWWAASNKPTDAAFRNAGFKFYPASGVWEKDTPDNDAFWFSTHRIVADPRGSTWHDNPYYWSIHSADTLEFVGHYLDKAEECNLLFLSGLTPDEANSLRNYHRV